MNNQNWLLFIGLLLCQCFSSTQAQKLTIAVMDLKATSGLSSNEGVMLTDNLLNELVTNGVYKIVGRAKRDEILNKRGFKRNGTCDVSACWIEAGQLLGVQKIVGGFIVKLGTVYAVDLRMMDVKTGKLDRAFSRQYPCDVSNLHIAMKEAAQELSGEVSHPLIQKQMETRTANSEIIKTPTISEAKTGLMNNRDIGESQKEKYIGQVENAKIKDRQNEVIGETPKTNTPETKPYGLDTKVETPIKTGMVGGEDVYAGKGEFKAMEKTPEIVKKVAPIYPLMAKKRGSSGKVILYLLVDIDGHVSQADVAKSSGFDDLDQAAVESARQFIFTPAVAPGGKLARVWIMYPVTFTLD